MISHRLVLLVLVDRTQRHHITAWPAARTLSLSYNHPTITGFSNIYNLLNNVRSFWITFWQLWTLLSASVWPVHIGGFTWRNCSGHLFPQTCDSYHNIYRKKFGLWKFSWIFQHFGWVINLFGLNSDTYIYLSQSE